jgi:replicative DNA helicase
MTSGLQQGDLIIIAGAPERWARPRFAMNIVEHLALVERKAVAVFSMEMSGTQLVMRMIGSVGKVRSAQGAHRHASRTTTGRGWWMPWAS